VHACAFKPFHMQQRSSSSCQTWKQLVCQGDYLQESALGTNHLYRFRDVKPHLFVWNRLQRKSRPDCGSTDQEGKETTTCRNFSEEIQCRVVDDGVALLEFSTPRHQRNFQSRRLASEKEKQWKNLTKAVGTGGGTKERKKKKPQANKKITRKTKFLETKRKIKAKSRRVEKQAHTARETHKRKNTVGKQEEGGVALKGDIR
jgi:hypothetical protein